MGYNMQNYTSGVFYCKYCNGITVGRVTGDMRGSHMAATHSRLSGRLCSQAEGFISPLSHTAAQAFSRCCQKELIIENRDYSYMPAN